ncbi:MAG: MoaD/ThiS family protein [Candidatus Thorarchaeota archaeon]
MERISAPKGVVQMSVAVELFGILAQTAGIREISIEVSESITVEQLLDELIARLGNQFKRLLIDKESEKYVPLMLMINGKDAPWKETREKLLVVGDRVAILPPIAGG